MSAVARLTEVAERLADHDWSAFPVGLNDHGKPKRPLVPNFTRLRPEMNADHDWAVAIGVAVALGPPSGGLAIIDIDDRATADYTTGRLLTAKDPPLMAESPRGAHIFVVEPRPSLPQDLAVWPPGRARGRPALVQLLGSGCYAVLPPTEGYRWLTHSEPAYGDVASVWRRIALGLAMPYERAKAYHFASRERSPRLSIRELREALR